MSREQQIRAKLKQAHDSVDKVGTSEQRDRLQQLIRKYDQQGMTSQLPEGSLERGQTLLKPEQVSGLESKMIVPGQKETIDTKQVMKQISGNEFADKQAQITAEAEARMAAKKAALGEKKLWKLGGGLKAVLPLAGVASALYSGDSPAAGLAEDLMPDVMQPSESGPARGTPEFKMESGKIPQSLRYSPEEEAMIRQRRGYEDGGMPKKLDINDLNVLRQLKDAKSEIDESQPEEYTEKLAIRRAL